MRQPLVLSLFPGIGLLDRAFEEEGFCVVRGPDPLWGGDVKRFHPPCDRFDGVIGGPPCQLFSRMRHIQQNAGAKHGNLIPEFERVVLEARPRWFVMENVEDAPIPAIAEYSVRAQLLRDVWVGGESIRLRRISFGSHDGRALHVEQLALHPAGEVSALAQGGNRLIPVKLGGSGKLKPGLTSKQGGPRSALNRSGVRTQLRDLLFLQGLPDDFLAEAPFTAEGKRLVVGQGVPLAMGRAIAKAVRRAMYPETTEASA